MDDYKALTLQLSGYVKPGQGLHRNVLLIGSVRTCRRIRKSKFRSTTRRSPRTATPTGTATTARPSRGAAGTLRSGVRGRDPDQGEGRRRLFRAARASFTAVTIRIRNSHTSASPSASHHPTASTSPTSRSRGGGIRGATLHRRGHMGAPRGDAHVRVLQWRGPVADATGGAGGCDVDLEEITIADSSSAWSRGQDTARSLVEKSTGHESSSSRSSSSRLTQRDRAQPGGGG